MVVLQRRLAVGGAVQPSGLAKAAGMGGKQHRGQSHRLDPHHRQHRQDHRQAAPAKAGKIVDT